HSSLPVSGSSATSLPAAARYIIPLTTIGVISVPPVIPSALTVPILYVHAWVIRPTFFAVIWASGEKRVPPGSLLYIGHSAAAFLGVFLTCPWRTGRNKAASNAHGNAEKYARFIRDIRG